jgi:hypothetical protein
MEDIIESTVNAEPVGNVEPQETQVAENATTEQVETTESVQGETANSTVEKPVQDAQTNAQYAKIRREAEQRAKDAVIAELYSSQGINTYADYQKAIQEQQRQQEAQQKGIDPEFYGQFKSMEEKLNAIEREKTMLQQEQTLSNDPKVGQLFNEWKTEVKGLAQQYNVDLDTAFTILARERIADVMASQRTKAEQEAIKGLQQNAQTTPGSIRQGGEHLKNNIKDMPSKDFNSLVQKVLNGEVRQF